MGNVVIEQTLIIFIVLLLIGFIIHRFYTYFNNRIKIDPDEVEKLAEVILKAKRKNHAELVADWPSCDVCGPNVRHINVVVD